MFEMRAGGGLFENLAVRWRDWRGVDRWPLISGTVSRKEYIENPEGGGFYKITLTYPNQQDGKLPDCVVTLTDNVSAYSYVESGDKIPLRVHPAMPNRAAFDDLANSGHGIMFWTFCVFLVGLAIVLRSCK